MGIMNPNDESTLTSFSGNTPVPRENTPCSGTDTEDDEDKMPMKFAQIYTDNLLHHTKTISSHHHDGYTSSFYSKKHNEGQSAANSYDSETSQSLAEAAETDTDTTTERDIVVDNEESEYFVPQEVTCQEQEVSFIDTSFELSSPLSQHADRPYDRELPEPRRLQQHCQPEHEYEEVIHQASSAQSERKHSRQEDAKLKPEADTTKNQNQDQAAFLSLRLTYLIVTLVIMLADGLQGTHLYVLYEGYGFSVASLYCLGFVTGGLASPITGPLVDKLGRKKSALLYCILEIAINMLEQYPILPGLIISRMVGGITTNLLSTVFDAWLDTEYRRRGLDKEGYEIIMRDSVIVSNVAAIGSGYLAHILAERYGNVGPFEGAVTFTSIALIVVMFVWTENYGSGDHQAKEMREFLGDAVTVFKKDKKVLRVGVIQGFTCASIQIFIFLWSPALRHFARSAAPDTIGLDDHGEPAYGLIFGAFMAAGVCGGLAAPFIRRLASFLLSPVEESVKVEGEEDVRPMAVEMLSALCYLISAFLLLVPCLVAGDGPNSFSTCLGAFLIYEFMVGLYLPCEGVIRSLYFPAEGRASIMTLPRIIVNCAVSLGVVSTTFISMRSAFSSIVFLMFVSAILQLSLISSAQWSTLSDRFLADTTAASKPVDLSRNSVDSTTTFDKPQLSRLNSVATEAATSLNHSSDWEDDDLLATSSGVAYQKIKCE